MKICLIKFEIRVIMSCSIPHYVHLCAFDGESFTERNLFALSGKVSVK